MKRTILIIIVIFSVFTFGKAFGQPQKGNTEFSFSFSYWLINEKGDDSDEVWFNFPLRLGYYITDNIELEPELTLSINDDTDNLDYIIILNFAYNFKLFKNSTLFTLAGIGYGNAINLFSIAANPDDIDISVKAFDLGAGFKNFITPSVAIRTEYRFTNYWGEGKTRFDKRKILDIDTDIHNVFVGISFFFK